MGPERRGRGLRPAASLLCLLLAQPVQPATDPDQTSRQLDQLRQRIAAVQQRLETARRKESRLSQALSEAERRIGRTGRRLHELNARLERQQRRLDELRAQRQQQQVRLDADRERLRGQVRAAYLLGRQEQLKLLLSPEDPQALGRTLVYYRYLNQARVRQIRGLRETLATLARLETEIGAEVEQLAATRREQQAALARLEKQRAERAALLAGIRAGIRGGSAELERLRRDEQRLQGLLEELRHALADVEQAGAPQLAFAKQRRKLPWPVAGRLRARFGQPRGVGGLRWRGVFISAPAEQPVKAVSHGRVAFADWLRGFGLLIILDHGDGYMSLYGHNQALFREPGDWVEAGEVIAAVGDSGGMERSGLYFELRHRGKPIDPLKWCAGRPTALAAARR
ncbi:peptidoglycan DD-metalloendopeptidase family protein [Thiohalobacter sp. IOR34]|uniref:murein hydrolase activator EnvC family protein n=1 Tax=Thiohalobacter sp. IOR34 TaxID=3057176 RepID=UPI0025B11014|nr:peptidoglycan DD-metalloendopeptidase family protein [Thiohalobacter sp. IOR34]WJW75550.1 peptidoglycan DD-metalloendopeptidase family protein [Thiohalobacter sp. IOR34]